MNTTDYKTGWIERSWIEIKKNSTFCFINDFRCKVSGLPLEKVCLMVERTNFKHRGNETDELDYYNRSSTPDKYKEVWDEWDEKRRYAI